VEDGALALDSHELWDQSIVAPGPRLSQSQDGLALKADPGFATVPQMATSRPPRAASRSARPRRSTQTGKRVAILLGLAFVLVLMLSLTAFGGSVAPVVPGAPAPAQRLVPAGPPSPEVVALQGPLRLQLPVPQSRVTAIGYHASGDAALPLEPVGHQANQGFLTRTFHKIFGGSGGGLRWYQLGGDATGSATAELDVGAEPGTDVYAPVDGTVVGITDYILDGRPYGVRIDVQPAAAPSSVVTLTHLRPDPSLTVGSTLAAGTSKIGNVVDFSGVEKQALARYTQDAGNHVTIEVRPAAALTLR
jgi:hypothetical protein